MSHTIKTIIGHQADKDIHMGSFAGAPGVGQCIQLTQSSLVPHGPDIIHLDKAQVVEMVEAMRAWLDQ